MPDIHAFAAATGAIRSYQTAFREGKKEKAEEEYLKAKRFLDALTTGGNIQEQRQQMQIRADVAGRKEQLFPTVKEQAELGLSEAKIVAGEGAAARAARDVEARVGGDPSEARRVARLGVEAGQAESVVTGEAIERGAVRAEADAVRKEADVETAQTALAKGQAQLATMEVQAQTALEKMLGAKTRSLLSALAQVELAGVKAMADKKDIERKLQTGFYERRRQMDRILMDNEDNMQLAKLDMMRAEATLMDEKKLAAQLKAMALEKRNQALIKQGYDPAMVDAYAERKKAGLVTDKMEYSQELRMMSATLANIQRSATIKEATQFAQEQVPAPQNAWERLTAMASASRISSLGTQDDKKKATDTMKSMMNFVLKMAQAEHPRFDWESLIQETSSIEADQAERRRAAEELQEIRTKGVAQ